MRSMKWGPPWVWFVVPAMLACGGNEQGAPSADTGDEKAVVSLKTVAATPDRRPVTLSLDGTLVADEQSQVTSVVAGRVVKVHVERGSVVAEGAPLITLRDVDYRLQSEAAQAQLAQARARLGMAEDVEAPPSPDTLPDVQAAKTEADLAASNAKRAEELGRRGVLSAQELEEAQTRAAASADRYQTALNGARAAVAALKGARVALQQAKTAASETVVRAPFRGEIANRMVSVGEFVTPQTSLVDLVRVHPLRIELQVPQRYLTSVQKGAQVELRVDAVPERTFQATVQYVSAAVQSNTRSLTVEAIVPNEDRVLRPGLFATAKLSTGDDQDVTLVPSGAVLSAAGVDRAFVVKNGVVEERIVSLGERLDDRVVILQGLAPGEHVAADHLDEITDGTRVSPQTGSAKK
ncbi:MAG: efflux RND transporter periplasmic adaptor subunit [Myxococcales bacterium]|nr:efflux RND transporter periplasmic adaptor subunit [Myxococcales bacterium]